MKFCERPWTMWYLTDAEKGDVRPCAWLDSRISIGNILNQDISEILQSDKLKKLRESILDGSFRYCDSHRCRLIANNTLPDLSKEEIDEIIKTPFPHKFNIAYDETCNHACSSCRKEYFKGSASYYEKVDRINSKMLPYYNKASYISANGRGDIFACEHLLSMFERLKPEREDFSFMIETNAALFDEKHWERISALGKYPMRVIVTVNSFRDTTYRFLNGYANHVDKVIDNLRFISSLRSQDIINRFEMSMIVQESNFRELPEFVERCLNEFHADAVRVRGIMQYSMPENEFWIKDVFNPEHPFYKEAIDVLHHPVMKDSRVWFWEGDYERVRKPKEMPTKRFEQYYNLLWQMCKLDDEGQLAEIFTSFKDKKIALYSAGHLTEYLARKMKSFGIIPVCIYDRGKHGGEIEGIPIYLLDEDTKIDSDIEIVINPLAFYRDEIEESFQKIEFGGKIIDLNELIVL